MEGRSRGQHLIVDCINVPKETCTNDKNFLKIMCMAAEKAGATVINQIRYRFGHNSPDGFTAIAMLDESHCSVHCYADLGLLALDFFTCGNTDPKLIFNIIQKNVDLGEIQDMKYLERFQINDGQYEEILNSSLTSIVSG